MHMFLSQKIISSLPSTFIPCIPSTHPFHTFFSTILYPVYFFHHFYMPAISSLLSPSYPSSLVHENSLCKYYSKSLIVGLMKKQVLQNMILCRLVIFQESFHETILQKFAIISATFLMYKTILFSLPITNLPGKTNRKNYSLQTVVDRSFVGLTRFLGPL